MVEGRLRADSSTIRLQRLILREQPVPLPFDQLMKDLAAYLQTELTFEHDVYSLVVPLPSGRRQEVAATIRRDRDSRELIDFVSTVGQVHAGIDPWFLLQANGQSFFSRVTVARQMIFVIATQLLPTADPEEVLLMLHEVALFADQLEQRFFQSDTF